MIHTFSFSLTGNRPRYTLGIGANDSAIKSIFGSNSRIVLHIDETVDRKIIPSDWEIVVHELNQTTECHFWRFETAGDTTRDMVHIRDIDSVVSEREYHAIKDVSTAYCMRDHWWHSQGGGAPFPVQGGMWGINPKIWPMDFTHLVKWWTINKAPFERYSDMWFLNRYAYPYIRRFGVEFDGCGSEWGGNPFPTERDGNHYVGEVAFH